MTTRNAGGQLEPRNRIRVQGKEPRQMSGEGVRRAMQPGVAEIAPGERSLSHLGMWSPAEHPGPRQELQCCFCGCTAPTPTAQLSALVQSEPVPETLWARVSCERAMSNHHSWKTHQTLLLYTEIPTNSKPACSAVALQIINLHFFFCSTALKSC